MGSKDMPRRFSERQAAQYLGLAYQSLKNWRATNQAPPFYRIGGKIIYDADELATWMEARRVSASSVNGKREAILA